MTLAIWRSGLYVVRDTTGTGVELEEYCGKRRRTVSLSDSTLIIDPTDAQVERARRGEVVRPDADDLAEVLDTVREVMQWRRSSRANR